MRRVTLWATEASIIASAAANAQTYQRRANITGGGTLTEAIASWKLQWMARRKSRSEEPRQRYQPEGCSTRIAPFSMHSSSAAKT